MTRVYRERAEIMEQLPVGFLQNCPACNSKLGNLDPDDDYDDDDDDDYNTNIHLNKKQIFKFYDKTSRPRICSPYKRLKIGRKYWLFSQYCNEPELHMHQFCIVCFHRWIVLPVGNTKYVP